MNNASSSKSFTKRHKSPVGDSCGNSRLVYDETEEGDSLTSHSQNSRLSDAGYTLQARWEEMFCRLLEFRRKHGHCLVPNRYSDDPQLGAWVSTQRRQYKILTSGSSESTPMTPVRANRLAEIGFEWSTRDPRHVAWETRYAELRDFVKKYGHAQVPIGWEANVQLSNWVSTQRQEYKLLQKGRSSRLTDERINLLNDIGFVWEAQRGGPRRRRKSKAQVQQSDDSRKSSNSDDATSTQQNQPRQPTQQRMQKMQPTPQLYPMQQIQAMQPMQLMQQMQPVGQMQPLQQSQMLRQGETSPATKQSQSGLSDVQRKSEDNASDISTKSAGSATVDSDKTDMNGVSVSTGETSWQFVSAPSMPIGVVAPQGFFPFAAPWGWHPGMQMGMAPGWCAVNPLQTASIPSEKSGVIMGDQVASHSSVAKHPACSIMEDGREKKKVKESFHETKGENCASSFTQWKVQPEQKRRQSKDDASSGKKRKNKPVGLFGSESRRAKLKPFDVLSSVHSKTLKT